MQTVALGQSDIQASRIALGVMRMARKTPKEAAAALDAALQAGITFIDTADIYTNGEASRKFSGAMRELGISRDKLYIQTKFGIHRLPSGVATYDFSRDHLLEAIDFELSNLGVDYVDFALLHRPDTLVDLDELAEAFSAMKSTGKVRHFGVSNVNASQVRLLQSALGDEKLEVNQLQFGLGHTGMIQQELHVNMQDAESVDHDGGLLAFSRLEHITIQAWSPLQYGLFEGCILGDPKFSQLNEALDEMSAEKGISPAALAIAWILRHPARMQVLIGTMNPEHIADLCTADTVELTREDWYKLYQATGTILP